MIRNLYWRDMNETSGLEDRERVLVYCEIAVCHDYDRTIRKENTYYVGYYNKKANSIAVERSYNPALIAYNPLCYSSLKDEQEDEKQLWS